MSAMLRGLNEKMTGEIMKSRSIIKYGTRYTALLVASLLLSFTSACGGGGGGNDSPAATPSKAWGTAQLIETDNAGDAFYPQIAVDAGGNATAVWTQFDGTRNNIWANRFSAGSGAWATAQLIETNDVGPASDSEIVFDAGGNAIAVWEQFDGTRYNIWANLYQTRTEAAALTGLVEIQNGAQQAFHNAQETAGRGPSTTVKRLT